MDWRTITSAPYDRELAVIDVYGPRSLAFPCRRVLRGWVKAGTKEQVNIHPSTAGNGAIPTQSFFLSCRLFSAAAGKLKAFQCKRSEGSFSF